MSDHGGPEDNVRARHQPPGLDGAAGPQPVAGPLAPGGVRATSGTPYYGYPGYGGGPSYVGEEPHLLDYVKILHKRRWAALTAFVLVAGSLAINTYTTQPVYEATARILIEAENPNVISFKEVINQDQTQAAYYQTQYSILQSRTLARRTLQQLKMLEPADVPAHRSAGWIASVQAGLRVPLSYVKTLFGSVQQPVSRPADETVKQSRAIDSLLGHLTVSPIKNSRLVDLKYRSPNPELATRIANTHARQYIEQNLEYKFLSSKEASDWLAQRLDEQRQQVETRERAMQQYQEQNDAGSLDERENIVVQKLADVNAAVTRAKMDRIEREALYNQVKAVQNDRAALESMPVILTNSFIQQLKVDLASLQRQQADLQEKFGDRHPDMIRIKGAIQAAEARLQGEVAKVVESVRNDFLNAEARERSLTEALDTQKREALALNSKSIEYGVLRRDAESSRQIYESLLQRVKETGVSTELKTSNIRIVDPAETPRSPILPQHGRDVLFGLLGGALLGIGLAFTFEYLDNRIKTPEEIKKHLGLAWLGMIPMISDKQMAKVASPLVNDGVPPNFSEAFKAVRTNVLFSSAEEGARSVVVTSAGASEGKTVVSSNLAITLAQAGQHVLLLDADLRRPRIHDLFQLAMEPGLSNLLAGTAKASEVVHRGGIPGLWVLPAGHTPPNPAELLASRRFRDFIGSLHQHFDWIIIDSPPVMAVTDACVMAHVTSGVVFVTAAEITSRHMARAAVEQLHAARCSILGAVLNLVDLHRNGYYYSNYYRREYYKYYVGSNPS